MLSREVPGSAFSRLILGGRRVCRQGGGAARLAMYHVPYSLGAPLRKHSIKKSKLPDEGCRAKKTAGPRPGKPPSREHTKICLQNGVSSEDGGCLNKLTSGRGFLADVLSAHTIQLVLHRLPAACGGQFMAIRDEVAF